MYKKHFYIFLCEQENTLENTFSGITVYKSESYTTVTDDEIEVIDDTHDHYVGNPFGNDFLKLEIDQRR